MSDDGALKSAVSRYGWRAVALPALAVVIIVALVISLQSGSGSDAAGSETSGSDAQAAGGSADTSSPAASSSAAGSSSPNASSSAKSSSKSSKKSGSSGASGSSSSAASPAADSAAPSPDYVEAGDGTLAVVPGTSENLGAGGPLTQFDVQIEGGLGVDGEQFASYVEEILADERGWTAGGQRSFQRTSDGSAAMHILLVSPQHVEGYCPGYGTEGYTSCRYGDNVVINLARWSVGVPDYEGHLWEYRQYVINHEVGHYLGYGHVNCPGPGQKAPVMLQQTLRLEGCVRNPYPYPNSPADDPNAPG
ncbi:DUF3152 domain-containing protein [Cumulibacter soli]|uniref:DUF3152 domain-containing protein n=1 Tax=Cumulibacter soli TaxID=2546344 RepID=UPI00106768DE|nr:DUF3152 domain-containing protein [Cumulibacter soli]